MANLKLEVFGDYLTLSHLRDIVLRELTVFVDTGEAVITKSCDKIVLIAMTRRQCTRSGFAFE